MHYFFSLMISSIYEDLKFQTFRLIKMCEKLLKVTEITTKSDENAQNLLKFSKKAVISSFKILYAVTCATAHAAI